MKTLVIGDIHGRDSWKRHLNEVEPDKVVFIGDYFDNPRIITPNQILNFKDIVEFKQSRPDDVTLLIGNHDAHYMDIGQQYSGYQWHHAPEIGELLKESREHMQWCHSVGRYLFSHAGVTKDWCENNEIDQDNLVESINSKPIDAFKFVGWDPHGDTTISSPIWVRPNSLNLNRIHGWHQVVGHTRQNKINIDDPYVTLIDCLEGGEALILEEGLDGIDLKVSKITS